MLAFCLVRVRVTVSHTLPYSFIWSKLYILLFMTVVCVCAPFLTRKWLEAWKFCLDAQLPSGLCVGAKGIRMNRHTPHSSSKSINPKRGIKNRKLSQFCKCSVRTSWRNDFVLMSACDVRPPNRGGVRKSTEEGTAGWYSLISHSVFSYPHPVFLDKQWISSKNMLLWRFLLCKAVRKDKGL